MSVGTPGGSGRWWEWLAEILRNVRDATARSSAELDQAYALVVESPHDEQLRQAYAIVAARNGDRSRAEFIDLQLRYSRLRAYSPVTPPHDPVEDDSAAEAHSLGSRARHLLRTHHRNWAAPVRDRVRTYEFNRGFVELVGLEAGKFLNDAARIMGLAPILHLDLTDAGGKVAALADLPELKTLRSLSLEGGGVDDADLMALAQSPNLPELRWLSLANNLITFEGLRTALRPPSSLSKLLYVNLLGNPSDPRERYAHDLGIVVETWLPAEGQELEREYGHIPWLHLTARTVSRVQPDRFQVADRGGEMTPAGEPQGETVVR